MKNDTAPKPCPRCGRSPSVEPTAPDGWVVSCPDCYDGAPDGNREAYWHPLFRDSAIRDWNQFVEDFEECE